MKTAAIYVFSGTGNTRRAAQMVAGELEKRGIKTEVIDIRLPYPVPEPEKYDIISIAYPIHAFNAPKIVRNFARTFPPAREGGQRVFFFKTSGEPFAVNSSSSSAISHILGKKGYINSYDMHMLMPYNIMFRYKDGLAAQMYLHTQKMAALLAKRIAGEDYRPAKYNPLYTQFAMAFRVQWFGAWLNGHLLRVRKDRCVLCQKCVRGCPAGNITLSGGRIKFDGRCTMCMHCAMTCPENAVIAGFLNPWKVNGPYDFKKLVAACETQKDYINEDTRGYFRLFRKYYQKTAEEFRKEGLA